MNIENKIEKSLISNSGISKVAVSLFDDVRYNTKLTIDSVPLVMVCGYNMRSKLRWISLETQEGDVLLKRSFIKLNRKCALDSLAYEYDLDYYVTLKKKDVNATISESYDYLNWSKDFDLVFVGRSLSKTKSLRNNYIRKVVGGSNV